MNSAPRLSVVIGTFNRLPLLKKAVESILRETQTPVRVYVADAGSTDGTIDYLNSVADERIVPVLAGEKLGQAKAYNDVLKAVETQYVAWLSDDNEVVDGGLDKAVRVLDRAPRVGMVGLKTRDTKGRFAHEPYIGGISKIGVLNVNQGLLRTDLFRELGFFSESIGFYGIDPDLTARVLFAGHDIVYTKAVALHHHRDWADDPSTPAYAKLVEAQRRGVELYDQKYGALVSNSLSWRIKRGLWKTGRRFGLFKWNSKARHFGAIPRDWLNILGSPYISILDPLMHRTAIYHLRQRYRGNPMKIPADGPLLPADLAAYRERDGS